MCLVLVKYSAVFTFSSLSVPLVSMVQGPSLTAHIFPLFLSLTQRKTEEEHHQGSLHVHSLWLSNYLTNPHLSVPALDWISSSVQWSLIGWTSRQQCSGSTEPVFSQAGSYGHWQVTLISSAGYEQFRDFQTPTREKLECDKQIEIEYIMNPLDLCAWLAEIEPIPQGNKAFWESPRNTDMLLPKRNVLDLKNTVSSASLKWQHAGSLDNCSSCQNMRVTLCNCSILNIHCLMLRFNARKTIIFL